ncbi:MAG: TatD family hydrolase [Treponema sp.]|jgi:TatD DNase family protein|nr:TatD family hydrolase [Treponema sp.]
MQLIDIGVNLMSPSFDRDREAVAAAAAAAGVSPLVITGSSLESSAAALAFAEAHEPGLFYATAGIHPHNARFWTGPEAGTPGAAGTPGPGGVPAADSAGELRRLVSRGAAAALGECGLDYKRAFSPPDSQRRCFEEQLELAAELGKPVFLHEREAFEDFYGLLKKYRPRLSAAVVHCFTGTERELDAYIGLDCYIGITGWICDERRGSHLIPLVKKIPPDRLLLETDAPYLLPRNLPRGRGGRGGRNEPRHLPHIAAFVARALGRDAETLAAETFRNTGKFLKRLIPEA